MITIREHDVRDKVILIAGAGGLAHATARRLGAGGARLLIADLSEHNAEAAAEAAREQGGVARAVQFDIANEASVREFIDRGAAEYGRIDGLFNVVADISANNLGRDTDVVEIPIDVWQHTLDVNLTGFFYTIREAIPKMLATGGGSIVNVISAAAFIGEPVRVAYAVSKAGLTALTRHVASRWGREGIRINSLGPGLILTDTTVAANTDQRLQQLLDGIPNTRLGRPDDIAAMAVHLFSDDGAWIQGQSITVDGGATMRP